MTDVTVARPAVDENSAHELAHRLLVHDSENDLSYDLEHACRVLLEAADARERQRRTIDTGEECRDACVTADPRAILRVLVDDYGAKTVCKWAREIYGDDDE